ncbi:hypothetical protein G6F35_010645 [Rhizopus arrhizus]|nr:hypothetical protein G6F35_010645 [Rhizopus arrhizus]
MPIQPAARRKVARSGTGRPARPAQERILEQAHRVVGDRAAHQVLEIQHGRSVVDRHQVAWHVVTVGHQLGLAERVVHQPAVHQLQAFELSAVQFQAQVALQEPFVEQAGIPLQQRLAELAEVGRHRDRLQAQQLFDRAAEPLIGIALVEDLRQGRAAKGFQQQETGVQVLRQQCRHAQAVLVQQAAHAQPRPRIFQPRRRVHHDVAAAGAGGAPIAAHAGIDRGAFDHGVGIIQLDTGPLQALRAALGIGGGFGHAGISGRAGRANAQDRQHHDRAEHGAEETGRFTGGVPAHVLAEPAGQQRAENAQHDGQQAAHAVVAGHEEAPKQADQEADQDDVEPAAAAEQTIHVHAFR